jgi:hypothetical protein
MEFSPTNKRIFRTDEERNEDLPILIEMRKDNWTWAEITKHLNERFSTPYTVTQRDISQQYYAFIKSETSIIDTELERLSVLDDLDRIFQLAYEGYLSSLEGLKTMKSKEIAKNVSPDSRNKEIEMEVLERIRTQQEGKGNNAFLNTMIKVLQEKAKVLNLTQDNVFQQIIIPQVTEPQRLSEPMQSEQKVLDIMRRWDKD